MKILYVIGGLGTGGAERQLLYLAGGIARRCRVTVVSLSDTAISLLPEFRSVPGVRVVVCPKRPIFDATLLPRLVALLRQERPEIVHSFLRTANYWARVAALLAGVPIRIASERNLEVERGRVANSLDLLLALCSQKVVVNADAIRRRLIGQRVPASKIETIHNGVPILADLPVPEADGVRRELGFATEQPVVAFVGRLVKQKNVGLFLDMARALLAEGRKAGFVVVGDGELRARLEADAERLGVRQAVRFLGPRQDVARILGAVELLVLTSDWEGLPNVVLEALAAGVPVVGTDVGGVREIVRDGVTGYVVPPRDLRALVERVGRLLDDPGARAEFGRSGRADVEARFSVQSMIERTAVLYDRLLAAHALPPLAPLAAGGAHPLSQSPAPPA